MNQLGSRKGHQRVPRATDMPEALGIDSLHYPTALSSLHDALGVEMPEEHGGPRITLTAVITYLTARIAYHSVRTRVSDLFRTCGWAFCTGA